MKQHQAFPGKFLKADDFEQGPRTLTIKKVGFDKVNEEESKLIAYFREEDLGLVLNKTNFSMIEEVTGEDDTDNWAGAVLKVGRVKVDYQGKRVWGVRVIGAGVAQSDLTNTGTKQPAATRSSHEVTRDDDDVPPLTDDDISF